MPFKIISELETVASEAKLKARNQLAVKIMTLGYRSTMKTSSSAYYLEMYNKNTDVILVVDHRDYKNINYNIEVKPTDLTLLGTFDQELNAANLHVGKFASKMREERVYKALAGN